MKVYDKAERHIDGGEDKNEVIKKFKEIFSFLYDMNMLSDEGKEIVDIGIDASISLHERLLTAEGTLFIEQHYDNLINLNSNEIAIKLSNIWYIEM